MEVSEKEKGRERETDRERAREPQTGRKEMDLQKSTAGE